MQIVYGKIKKPIYFQGHWLKVNVKIALRICATNLVSTNSMWGCGVCELCSLRFFNFQGHRLKFKVRIGLRIFSALTTL